MEVKEYQELVKRTARLGEVAPIESMKNFSMGLCSEAGELIGMLKQHFYQGHDFNEANFVEEIGDCLWYLANLCNLTEYTLEDCMTGNINKLQKRYPDGFTPQDSIARVDVVEVATKRPYDGCDYLENPCNSCVEEMECLLKHDICIKKIEREFIVRGVRNVYLKPGSSVREYKKRD